MTTQTDTMRLALMDLADKYASAAAVCCAERLYGTSQSYTDECQRKENAMRSILDDALRTALSAPAGDARQLVSVSSIDVERLIAECLPGGASCDPQQVADAIRRYCNAWPVVDAQPDAAPVVPAGWPNVDEFAQQIRWLNGNSKTGAGKLAEKLLEWLQERSAAPVAQQGTNTKQPAVDKPGTLGALLKQAADRYGISTPTTDKEQQR